MFDKASDFRYVSGEVGDLDLSLDLMPLRTGATAHGGDKQAIIAGKDIAFLYESITERKFAAAIGSADDIVSFSRKLVAPSFPALSTHPAPDPSYRNRLVTYALDESATIPRVVYTDESAGSWSDLIEKASIPRATVQELPTADRIICKDNILAAFNNQAELNRFYTPNLSTVRAVTNMRVDAHDATAWQKESYTDNLYSTSGGEVDPHPRPVTESSIETSVRSEDGEVVMFKSEEHTSYKGHFHRVGYGDPKEGSFTLNEWHSECIDYRASIGYDLYQLSPAVNIAYGAKYRAVFHFTYSQMYSVHGFDNVNKDYTGSSIGYGYIIGDEVAVPEHGVSFVPRSNVFAPEVLSDILRRYRQIDPLINGFLNATNTPRWDELYQSQLSYNQPWITEAGLARSYNESIVIKPLGYIVTLGNHTRWKS